jgi:ABC-type uncharacterized transport system ATPase subunit
MESGDPAFACDGGENRGLVPHRRDAPDATDELGADQAFVDEGLALSEQATRVQHSHPRARARAAGRAIVPPGRDDDGVARALAFGRRVERAGEQRLVDGVDIRVLGMDAGDLNRRGSLDPLAETASLVGVNPNLPISRLSGGQQQMLAIGRALMGNPELLLLDEPSLGLAPLIIHQIFEIVIRLAERGVSIILVEQNVDLSFEIADFIYALERGRVHCSGPADKLRGDDRVRDMYLPRVA